MKLEQGVISSSQLTFLIVGFIMGSTLLIAFIGGITKHDSWLAVVSGWVVSVPFVLSYIFLAQKFPGKNLIQINDLIYGSYLGKLVSVLYICYFWQLISQNLRFIADFVLTFILPETPMVVILIMFTFISAWAVRSGLEVIARCSIILVTVSMLIVLTNVVLLLKEMKLTNFLPVFDLPLKDFIHGTHVIAAIPLGELVVFLMIMGYINKIKQVKSSALLGLTIGGAILLVVTLRDIAVLGITYSVMISPSFEAIRQINIANIITRMEILVAITLLFTFFLKVSVFYYGTALGTAQLLNLRSYVPLVLPIGIISITLAVLVGESKLEQSYNAANIWIIYVMPFEFILPPLTLLIAKIRGLPQKQGGKIN
jgi:spore germination protein KB